MRALVVTSDHSLEFVTRPKPQVSDQDRVVIRVVHSGICGTDRSVLVGKFPARAGTIMGHEAVGVVAETGAAVSSVAKGDRVVINPTLYCGWCGPCLRGAWNFCANKSGTEVGIDYDGSFADYISLPSRFVHKIPEGIDYDRAVVIEPLACALNNVRAAKVQATDTVLVLGGGPMGVLTAMLCGLAGSAVTLWETDPDRRELARQILDFGTWPVLISANTPTPAVATVAFDTVGNQLGAAIDAVANQDRIVIVGFNDQASVNIAPLRILQRGLTIIGAGDYNGNIFPEAIDLAKRLPPERLITHRFPLEDHKKAFALLSATNTSRGYGAMKVLLTLSKDIS